MRGFLLDTDHMTFLSNEESRECAVIKRHLEEEEGWTFSNIVSFHEQMSGIQAAVNRGRKPHDYIYWYDTSRKILQQYQQLPLLSFEADAAVQLEVLISLKIRIGRLDLRIGSIALANDLKVVTRNRSDFERIPGLQIENWTK